MEPIGRVLAVSVGQPRTVPHDGGTVRTAIFKEPVEHPVLLTRLGFEGDGQADRKVHGGPARAAYLYPFEHYAHWAPRLGGGELPYSQFGENLTTEGLLEDTVHVGDVFAMGQARVQISSPRGPCFKLGIRTGDPSIVKPFLASRKLGFYLRVLEEGRVAAGDAITLVALDPAGVTMAELIGVIYDKPRDPARLARVLACRAVFAEDREYLEAGET
jgi:MOSC domain-containing protein YiiM